MALQPAMEANRLAGRSTSLRGITLSLPCILATVRPVRTIIIAALITVILVLWTVWPIIVSLSPVRLVVVLLLGSHPFLADLICPSDSLVIRSIVGHRMRTIRGHRLPTAFALICYS